MEHKTIVRCNTYGIKFIAVSDIEERIKELKEEIKRANEEKIVLLVAKWNELEDLISEDE